MKTHKITSTLDYSSWYKRSNSIKVPKVTQPNLSRFWITFEKWYKIGTDWVVSPKLLSQRTRKRYHKTLGTSVINSPMSSSSLVLWLWIKGAGKTCAVVIICDSGYLKIYTCAEVNAHLLLDHTKYPIYGHKWIE